MKKGRIFASILLAALLTGCGAPSDGGAGNNVPPTTPPPSESVPAETETVTPPPSEAPDEMAVEFDIEGTRETMTLQKHTGENFVVYVDKDGFTTEESGQDVKFLLKDPDPETYPDVFITISYEQGVSAQARHDALVLDGGYTDEGERTLGENRAQWLHAGPGPDARWESPVHDVYLIGGEAGLYTITLSYYVGAAEGWGARMHAMAGTFLPA